MKASIGFSEVSRNRSVPPAVRTTLLVRSAGRCEFDGCNVDLLEHHVTLQAGFYGEVAHIIAFKIDGPRGRAKRPQVIHDISNLMLLCDRCHKLVDGKPNEFSVEALRRYKEQHEDRVRLLTGLSKDKTVVVKVLAKIGGFSVDVSNEQAFRATAPYYPKDTRGHLIDLRNLDVENSKFIDAAIVKIDQETARLYQSDLDGNNPKHISVFAFAPIPVLIYLGSKLSNKIPTALFQRHRDTEDWAWKSEHAKVEFTFRIVRPGSDSSCVAVAFSISGSVDTSNLPPAIGDSYFVYELAPKTVVPSTAILRSRETLSDFRRTYQMALALLGRDHPGARSFHVFPAVPIPMAVAIGLDILPKVTPDLEVYDNNKAQGGFVHVLTVKGKV
jgi:hypothetical protein